MTKTILSCFTSLLFIYTFAQQPVGNTFNYEFYSTKSNHKQSTVLNDLFETNPNPVEYIYQTNGNEASFNPILVLNNSQTGQFNLLQISVKTFGEFYYNLKENLIENKKEISNKEYIITSKLDDLYWIDLSEVEEVNGVLTKKYITKRKEKGLKADKIYTTTVWVDEAYPMNIAPFDLTGLKGLVMKVNFNRGSELILKQIENRKLKEIKPLKAKNSITKAEYQKLIDEQMENLRNKKTVSFDIKN